jgi:hypothetical protein
MPSGDESTERTDAAPTLAAKAFSVLGILVVVVSDLAQMGLVAYLLNLRQLTGERASWSAWGLLLIVPATLFIAVPGTILAMVYWARASQRRMGSAAILFYAASTFLPIIPLVLFFSLG